METVEGKPEPTPSGAMASLLAYAKSKLTGEAPAEVGKHEKVLVAH